MRRYTTKSRLTTSRRWMPTVSPPYSGLTRLCFMTASTFTRIRRATEEWMFSAMSVDWKSRSPWNARARFAIVILKLFWRSSETNLSCTESRSSNNLRPISRDRMSDQISNSSFWRSSDSLSERANIKANLWFTWTSRRSKQSWSWRVSGSASHSCWVRPQKPNWGLKDKASILCTSTWPVKSKRSTLSMTPYPTFPSACCWY